MRQICLRLIEGYQAHADAYGPMSTCNFEPTCSEYARLAILHHGILRGLSMAYSRLRRCNSADCVDKKRDPVPLSSMGGV